MDRNGVFFSLLCILVVVMVFLDLYLTLPSKQFATVCLDFFIVYVFVSVLKKVWRNEI